MTLIGADGEEFSKSAIGRRRGAGAAQHNGFPAEVDLPAFAVGTKAAGARRVYRHPLTGFHRVHVFGNRGHFGREFMAENERAVGNKGGVVAVLVVVQVCAANADTAGAQQHHARLQFRLAPRLDS